MFYDKQPSNQRENYKKMLKIIGSLSNLFSESDKPFLYYRCHENIFCKYFEARNLSREDCSADAQKVTTGIGLKTWVDTDNQKVAEFNKLKASYMSLPKEEMIQKIAEYRNERIRITMKLHGITEMIYHIVKRVPNAMQIYEYAFEMIDIENIKLNKDKGSSTNIYFNDGKHEYHFNISKSTLYMTFEGMTLLDSFDVNILEDPYEYLEKLVGEESVVSEVKEILDEKGKEYEQLCLRLYSTTASGEKIVHEKSGLNQWNAGGRVRNPNELYIPYPAFDRERSVGFFPSREESFTLTLPDGKMLSAKVCQADGKAIMSNPNYELGKWLLRDVFELPEGTLVTYEMLEKFGVDSVVFTKIDDRIYKIDFTNIGTYEELLSEDSSTDKE